MFNFIKLLLISIFATVLFKVNAQSQAQVYVVYLTPKKVASFNPYQYFDAKNIERKTLAQLPLFDERDLPINEIFINQIKTPEVKVLVASRWLNALFINTNSTQLERIKNLPFVKQIDKFIGASHKTIAASSKPLSTTSLQILNYQTARLQASEFANKNLTGKGIRIAVFDVGFSGTDKHKAFEHLRKNNQIKATYDFISKTENVYLGGAHGTNTLSCITGVFEGKKMGLATDAEFLLARTEWSAKEDKQEEYFWLAAAEWADKNGANIISSSLGYGSDWYTVNDMNGKKSVVAFAATVAAQKGILVVNSAGNEFEDNKWRTIITPADADSVLCVGGTDPFTDRHISFSSVGPSADYRAKPNISAPGHVVAANPNGTISQTYGTSFSCPLISGFAACAWQSNRSLTNMQLFKEIEKSGHLYPYNDFMHGYGIPQASFFTRNKTKVMANFIVIDSLKLNKTLTFQVTDSAIIKKYLALDAVAGQEKSLNLYWNITNEFGKIIYYELILVEGLENIVIEPQNIKNGYTMNFHFEGNTYNKTIE